MRRVRLIRIDGKFIGKILRSPLACAVTWVTGTAERAKGNAGPPPVPEEVATNSVVQMRRFTVESGAYRWNGEHPLNFHSTPHFLVRVSPNSVHAAIYIQNGPGSGSARRLPHPSSERRNECCPGRLSASKEFHGIYEAFSVRLAPLQVEDPPRRMRARSEQ